MRACAGAGGTDPVLRGEHREQHEGALRLIMCTLPRDIEYHVLQSLGIVLRRLAEIASRVVRSMSHASPWCAELDSADNRCETTFRCSRTSPIGVWNCMFDGCLHSNTVVDEFK
jgi:hypothetical protein